MAQITFRLDDATENTLRINAKKQHKSVSDYVRSLVDLGLRVEEASTNSDKNSNKIDNEIFQTLQIKSCIASIETLFISRQLYALNSPNKEETGRVFEQLHARSEELVNKFLGSTTS